MRFFFVFSAMALILFSNVTTASVWDDNQVWSLQYEDEFSNWMQSNNVTESIFTNPRSPYYGINTDCADTAYALRAIFAFEHKLPFAITSPSGSRNANKTINNRQNTWNASGSNNQRLVAMINTIGESVGTENLAYFDTFPIAIKSIRPGSVFMYKIPARFGNFIRHTYNIKEISDIGTFDVIYSTQANKAKKLPLIRRQDYEFDKLPNSPWGFKKFRWPEHLGLELSSIPKELGASNEQYTLAQSLGNEGFFKFVSKTLSSSKETSTDRLARTFKTVCTEATARINYVNQGIEHLNETNNRCMNYEEFDAYSTPARDLVLKESFQKLQRVYNEILLEGNVGIINSQLMHYSDIIFKQKPTTTDLLNACLINYRPGVSIDLATLWGRIEKNLLSSHPNDIIELRWGEKSKPTTRCKRWY